MRDLLIFGFGFLLGCVIARFAFKSEAERELEFIERGRRDDDERR